MESAAAGSDYTANSSILTFPANTNTPRTFSVSVTGDTIVELDEEFVVNLTNAVNATIADNQGTGTIVNDDAAQLSINDATILKVTWVLQA